MNVLSLISVLQSVEREFQSRVQTKDGELAEAQQKLRQKVNWNNKPYHVITHLHYRMNS